MMLEIEKEDWAELIQMLGQVEKNICSLDGKGAPPSEKMEICRQALRSFHTTAAMLGLMELEKAGLGMEACLNERIIPSSDQESIYVFGFALNALLDEVKNAANDSSANISVDEVMKLLEASSTGDAAAIAQGGKAGVTEPIAQEFSDEEAIEKILDTAVGSSVALDFSRLERIVTNLGGRLHITDDDKGTFQLHFRAQPAVVEQIETLLSPSDPTAELAPKLSQSDARLEKIMSTIKAFMKSLSDGDVIMSQEILLNLAEQQHQAGLYKEIGSLARELHNSLKGFSETLDPALKEMVEDKIPDSGNRLEHILELTENSANVTLDHVEAMQKRNHEDVDKLTQLREVLAGLNAIGEQAQKRLTTGLQIMEDLSVAADKTRDDLVTVLTAQDYQDLTGQVIMKIMALLKDLELKLVNVIRAFGVKSEKSKKSDQVELYGPAHKGKEEALHSQDDVDSLLAEFGF